MIVGRQHDKATAARTRERGGDIEDLHLRAGRVALSDSHRRQLVGQAQFYAPVLSNLEDLYLLLDGREMMRMGQLMFRHRFRMTCR